MHWPMHQALRCHAKSKRSGLQCRSPAVRGHSVCRMHGAGGGAPKGNRNALKHGDFTAETIILKRQIKALARMARETMGAIELGEAKRLTFARGKFPWNDGDGTADHVDHDNR
jgi:hypothetical protein